MRHDDDDDDDDDGDDDGDDGDDEDDVLVAVEWLQLGCASPYFACSWAFVCWVFACRANLCSWQLAA